MLDGLAVLVRGIRNRSLVVAVGSLKLISKTILLRILSRPTLYTLFGENNKRRRRGGCGKDLCLVIYDPHPPSATLFTMGIWGEKLQRS